MWVFSVIANAYNEPIDLTNREGGLEVLLASMMILVAHVLLKYTSCQWSSSNFIFLQHQREWYPSHALNAFHNIQTSSKISHIEIKESYC